MLYKIHTHKTKASSWMLLVFSIVILLGVMRSLFFQIPLDKEQEFENFRFLLNKNSLNNIQKINLKNKLGQFKFVKDGRNWLMVSPRNFPADNNIINKIIEGVTFIKIKKIYVKDAINISNFSLQEGATSLELISSDNTSQFIKFGLTNPFDQSSYLTMKNKKFIYQVEQIKIPLDHIDVGNIINSKIFSQETHNIRSFSLYKGNQKKLLFSKNLNAKKWSSQLLKSLDHDKAEHFLNNLFATKSFLIIDKKSVKLDQQLEKIFRNPIYKINIVNKHDKKVVYSVGPILFSLPDLTIEKRKYFIIRSSEKAYSFLVHKKYYPKFDKKMTSF